jgi:hypothetical protein
LIEAAQHWARCHLGDITDYSDFIEHLKLNRAPSDIIAEHEAMQEEEVADFEYDESEAEIITLFLRLENRWQLVEGFSGARFAGCDIGFAVKLMELRKTNNIAERVDELLLMEAAAKNRLNLILQRRAEERRSHVK